MKQNILLLAVVLSMLISCNKNDDSTSCVEPPSGMIEADKTNITVFFEDGLVSFDTITFIDNNDVKFNLDVSGFSKKSFSDWQVIPDLNFTSIILVTSDDMFYEFKNVDFIHLNELVLKISRGNDGGFDVSIEAYIPCDDTPNS